MRSIRFISSKSVYILISNESYVPIIWSTHPGTAADGSTSHLEMLWQWEDTINYIM